jgi:hypothetical protein
MGFKKHDPINIPSILTANLLHNWVYNYMAYLRQLVIRQDLTLSRLYKVVQIWPGLIVCKQVTVCPGHIWTTLYLWKEPDNGLIVGPKPVASRAFVAMQLLCTRLKIESLKGIKVS